MSVLDKFLNIMHVNDDDYDLDDDDYLDDDADTDLDDSRPARRLIHRRDDADDVPQPAPAAVVSPAPSPASVKPAAKTKEKRSFFGMGKPKAARQPASYSDDENEEQEPPVSKVSAFRPRRTYEEDEETNNYSVCVIRPKSMEDALEIAKTLISHCVVILNLEGLDLDVSQRIFDFASGSCCALQGRLDKISNYIFVLTPRDINISGEFQEILTGTFDADVTAEEDNY